MTYLADLSYGADTRVVLFGTTRCPRDSENLPPIPHVEQNILRLSRLFTDPDIIGLPLESIVTLLDWEESSAVVTGIFEAAQQANDTLIVYYAGHGIYGDADSPLYLPTLRSTSRGKAFDAVAVTRLKRAMAQSPARKRMLILDCCHAGRAFAGEMAETTPEALIRPAIDVDGTFGIAAVPGDLKALAPPNETLTRFTGALVDVLERGIERDQPTLNVEEVFKEVERRIGRKADAPLPRQINWDRAEAFILARNRSLRRPGADRLFQAIEGLRETMTATGARLASIEAKGATLDDLVARVATMETKLHNSGSSNVSTTPNGDVPTSLWRRVGMTQTVWDNLPAKPYKLQVRHYFAGRRNAAMLLMLVTLSTFFGCGAIYVKDEQLAMLSLATLIPFHLILSILLTIGLVRKDGAAPPVRSESVSDSVLAQLEYNDRLNEVMHARVIKIFGQPLEGGMACIAAVVSIMGAFLIFLIAVGPTGYIRL